MDAQEAWGDSGVDRGPNTLSSYLQRSGIYIFLISFACVYYLSNASLPLGHYDLGWHLAAGDLIRDQGSIPLHDPWSFTSEGRQWYNLSWLWDVIASVLFQYSKFSGLTLFTVACGAVIVGYLTSICLSSGASVAAVSISVFSACLLYPSFATAPNVYLAASPNTVHHAVFRHVLRRMSEANEMVFAAFDDGSLGQSARRLFAWLSRCRRFLRRGLAQTGLGRFQNLQSRGSGLLSCNIHQSSRLAHL